MPAAASPWIIAVVAGVLLALLQYGWRQARPATIPAGLLRAAAVVLVTALLLDAPSGCAHPLSPWVALDASASWHRAANDSGWASAVNAARESDADSTYFFGDSLRAADLSSTPRDAASVVAPAVERALAGGRPLVVITDGEINDPESLDALPVGSRVVVVPRAAGADLAVTTLEMPRAMVSGDTAEVRIGVVAGAAGSSAGEVSLVVAGEPIASARVDSLAAFAERIITLRTPVRGPEGPALATAIATAPGDRESLNDTLSMAIDLSRAASAVFVSTSPDYDARYALAVLRGAVSIPTRGYFRVAPGQWRAEGPLTAVAESEVRRAVRDAPLVVLHGDTAVFGPPAEATRAPLALATPVEEDAGEWYAADAPPSPLSTGLSGMPWDSLPPIAVSATAPHGDWVALEARRGREPDRRVVIAGRDAPRRTVIVAASGLWRWRFRGGATADAFTAVWGSIFDWLAAERADRRAALPDGSVLRAGDPVRWRRGSAADSSVTAVLTRRGTTRSDSLLLQFGSGISVTQTPPLAAGVYDVRVPGGAALIAVNASPELLPSPAHVRSGAVGAAALGDTAPHLRSAGWAYALALLLLCAEWVLRRRLGMR